MAVSIIVLILYIIAIVLIFKFVKGIIKAIFLALSLLIIILVVCGVFIAIDLKDIQDNMQTKQNIFLFEKDNILKAGIYWSLDGKSQPGFPAKEDIDSYSSALASNNLKEIKGDYYKVIFVNENAFAALSEIKSNQVSYTKQQLIDALNSENSIDSFIKSSQKDVTKEQLAVLRPQLMQSMNIKSDEEFKGLLFAMLFKAAVEQQGASFILDQYKEGNVKVYPETIVFKALKLVPSSVVKKAIGQSAG